MRENFLIYFVVVFFLVLSNGTVDLYFSVQLKGAIIFGVVIDCNFGRLLVMKFSSVFFLHFIFATDCFASNVLKALPPVQCTLYI